jgi:predicted deacylase
MSVYSLLTMTAPLRDTFHVAYHDLGSPLKPPKAVFVGGIHGNELNTVFVLARLAHFLDTLAKGPKGESRLKERVLVIPAVNVVGVNTQRRFWPFDNTDINRMFPGYNQGETSQRIADAVFQITKPAHYRVDLHASNADFEELPQVRLYDSNDSERRTARLFELPAVIERGANPIVSSTIGHSWRRCGGENFVLQAGLAGQIQPEHCERLFHALVTFLTRAGILTGVHISDADEESQYFGPDQSVPLISQEAGLFVSKTRVGRWVQAGDVLGSIYDSFAGEVRSEVVAPVDGLLSGLRRQPLLCEGDLIARLQTRKPVPELARAVDTYSSRGQ